MVLDASAALAFRRAKTELTSCGRALAAGALTGAANWAEVAQKVVARERLVVVSWSAGELRPLVEPVTQADAERAAARWPSDRHLSLGDRSASPSQIA
jgi:PIN domain nuclease of toxin-antitoxin system